MILSQYNAAYDDFILNKNEMCSLHADGLLLTAGTSKQSTVWELLHVRAPKTDVDEIELVLYFTQNVNVINISYSRNPGLPSGS